MNRAIEHADRYALPIGAGAAMLCILLALVPSMRTSFFNAWLFAWLFWLAISLGGMALSMLHGLTGGGWGVLVRPITHSATRALPLMFVLFIPVLLGIHVLFPWARSDELLADPILRHAHAYLNPRLFTIRWLVYFATWVGLSWGLIHTRSPAMRARISAAGLVLYVLTITLAGVDWIMSRQAHWVSSVFGFVLVCSQTLTALCFVLVILRTRLARPAVAAFAKPKHFVDLGNLLLMMVILWAYMNFAQFLITWTGNEQSDIGWYVQRTYRGWRVVAAIIIFVHFLIPLFLLLMRPLKADFNRLSVIAIALLALRILDLYWMVGPQRETDPHSGFVLSPLDVLAWIGIGGFWYAAFSRSLARAPDLQLPGETDDTWNATTQPHSA